MTPTTTPPKRHGFRALLFAVPSTSASEPVPPSAEAKAIPPVAPAPRRPGAPPETDELASAPATRGSGESHVRLRAMPLGAIEWASANVFLDEIAEDQLVLGMSIDALERAIAKSPRDPSARAALDVLQRRIGDLAGIRDVLSSLHVVAADRRVHRVFLPDAPLAEYLRGVYAWMHAALRALEQLAHDLRALQPDWARLRYRLEEAKMFHFDELEDAITSDLLALGLVTPGGVPDLEHVVRVLLAGARALEARLDERFG